jgi:hypothetical protein
MKRSARSAIVALVLLAMSAALYYSTQRRRATLYVFNTATGDVPLMIAIDNKPHRVPSGSAVRVRLGPGLHTIKVAIVGGVGASHGLHTPGWKCGVDDRWWLRLPCGAPQPYAPQR